MTGETVSSISVGAYWTSPGGTSYSASTNASGSSYTLTVNVPQGSTPVYTVYVTAYLSGGGSLSFQNQAVSVTAAQTSVADFSMNPGRIAASVTSTVPGSLSYAYFYASGTSAYAPSGTATLLVAPGTPYVYGYAYFTDGTYVQLDFRYPTVGEGETVSESWQVTPPPPSEKGTITGTFHLNGASPDYSYVQASGPSYGSANPAADGSFTLSDLNVGGYGMYAYSYLNNSYLQLPQSAFTPSQSVSVAAGSATTVDINADAAFMSGKISFTGSASPSQVNSLSLNAYGGSGTNAYGGYAGTPANTQTGAYSLLLTEGGWSPASLNVGFYDPAPATYLNEGLNFFDYASYYNPTAVAAGQTLTKNLIYGTGAVTVNFSILGGALLSSPYLQGNCYEYDANNTLLRYYSVYSYGNASNATDGAVKFVGMAGTCTLNAWAQVGGSSTQFGTLTLDVVPGTDVVVDIGGPSLTVSNPAAGAITNQTSILVTGTAIDDLSVDSVTVNGIVATITPAAGVPQVNFSSPISLTLGPNQIVTVATDSSGKSSSDTRTVYRDGGAPTLTWSPEDQSISHVAGVSIIGSADDDAGIALVTVNGAVVFQSATPGSGPTHVDFNVPFTLALGDNFIEVVATDVSTQLTTQTHKVTYVEGSSDTTPPVITAANVTLEAMGLLTSAPFTATAVDDVDGPVVVSCSLTSPALVGVGSTVVNCTATDAAGNDATASLTLTVVDTTPPDLLLPENITMHALGTTTPVSFAVSATDLASGALGVQCSRLSGSSFPIGTTTVACSTTDGAGLTTSGSFTVTITNTVPSCGAVSSPSLLWPVNHKLVPIAINGVVDADGDAVAITVTGMFQDEPTNTEGDGNTSSDATGVGTANPQVRAERAGTNKVPGNGRVYHIKFTATDSVGGACTGEVKVGVPHDQGGKSTPVDGGALYNSVTGARVP